MMSKIILTPKEQPQVPLEVDTILPDTLAGKSIEEIKSMHIQYGNSEVELKEFFDVDGESGENPSELQIEFNGDVYNTKRIGEGMTTGEIVVKGNASMYVGAKMKGGKITVEGDVEGWAGRNMEGGEIVVMGNAGDYLGSAYRGDWRGMRGGKITVHGNAGREIAEYMLGGKIQINGNVKMLPGIHMNGGVLIIDGNVISRTGGEMKGGTIIVKGKIDEFLPGFEFLGAENDIEIDGEVIPGSFYKFRGDFATKGADGLVYAATAKNAHIVP
jgi:formylmethanofuran dehydrogenase subunit C